MRESDTEDCGESTLLNELLHDEGRGVDGLTARSWDGQEHVPRTGGGVPVKWGAS